MHIHVQAFGGGCIHKIIVFFCYLIYPIVSRAMLLSAAITVTQTVVYIYAWADCRTSVYRWNSGILKMLCTCRSICVCVVCRLSCIDCEIHYALRPQDLSYMYMYIYMLHIHVHVHVHVHVGSYSALC